MSTIEQAGKRLELLQSAGIPMPWAATAATEPVQQVPPGPSHEPVPSPVVQIDAQLRRHANEPLRHAPRFDLNLEALQAAGYLVPKMDRSPLADEFRQVKRALIRNAKGDPEGRHSLIMVTSALAGEGKTFCAINLAMSIAMEVDLSVLLIDADVMRPAAMKRLGVGATEKGLLDVLTRPNVDLADVIIETNVPKLSLLPSGTQHNRSTELLASASMEKLMRDLSRRYADRIVIFDTPPLLLTTAAPTLATAMGQIVMVVEASRTSRREVAEAFAAVEECPVVMSILNKSNDPRAGRRYAYYSN